jgi:hypothetical protein
VIARSGQARRTCRGDDGFVGGSEAMLFGVLVFVSGILLVFNAWAVVDAKMGVTAAAREAVRSYVESDGDFDLAAEAGRAAFGASTNLDVTGLDLEVAGAFARCARVSVQVRYELPALRLPFGGWGRGFEISATHSEIVDPYRSGLEGVATCD